MIKINNEEEMSERVPKLRFKEFSGEWEEKRLNEVSDIVRGGSPRPIDKYMTSDPKGLNWLKIGDVDKNSKYVVKTEERVKHSALTKTREVHPGDLILSNSMSFGRPYIMKIKSCIHDGWIAITNIDSNIETDFLYYMILSPYSQKFFIDNASGGGIRNLNADIIKSLPTYFPIDKKEQQKIANTLSSLDNLIEAQEKKVEALKKHKKGLMQQLFPQEGEKTPKLRFEEFSGEWEEKRLEEIANITMGSSPKSHFYNENKKGIPLLQGNADIKNRKSNPRIYTTQVTKECNKEDILLSVRAPVGVVAKSKHNACIGRGFASIRVKENNYQEWLYQWFLQFEDKWSNISQGGTFDSVNSSDIKNLKIYIPTPKEQQKIANTLSSLDNLIEAGEKKVEALKKHKKGLMQQMFVSEES